MLKPYKRLTASIVVVLIVCLAFPSVAAAQALPFQQNVTLLRDAMTGPIATIISLVGIVGCGAVLIFGGELSGFARTMVFVVLVVSVIVQAENIVTALKPGTASSSTFSPA